MKNKYVIAVSGGVDSMLLAHKLGSKNQAAAFVHINHHTRGLANDKDQQLVENIGKHYNVPVYIFDYFHQSGNFQASARKFRYEKLVSVAESYYNKIAVAHHLDDQLENCLLPKHHVKSNLIAYRVKFESCYIYRPLLGLRKENIYKQARDYGITFNEDISNQDTKYQRNDYRKRLKEAQTLKEAKLTYICERTKQTFLENCCVQTELNRHKLIESNENYRYLMIYNLIKSNNQNSAVKNRQLEVISKLIDSKKNSKFSIANCMELFIGYDKIYMLTDNQVIDKKASLHIGENVFNGIKFYSEFEEGVVRVWQPGDKIKIKDGHKKVARVFIDKKVEQHMRLRWPLIVDDDGTIIEIPKLWRKNEINK